jgi:shikimate dehydrogenase
LPKLGLIGQRIGYSASPAMHEAAFRAAGLDGWTYELWDVGSGELPATVGRLRGDGYAGANVTIPHKLAVGSLLDELDPLAAKTEAVNTIAKREGRLVGLNTDVQGIAAALRAVGFGSGSAVLLGRGGSARAAAAALEGLAVVAVTRDNWEQRGSLARKADLVVNCTPLGRSNEVILSLDDLPRRAVIDLVYVRGGTPLVRTAQAAGLKVADGWLVLLEQGAAAFEAWTGHPAPRAAMREALAA